MKLEDITTARLEAAENTYRANNPDPQEAGRCARLLEKRLMKTTLSIPAGIFKGGAQAIAFGIEIGLILAEQNANASSGVVDQAVS